MRFNSLKNIKKIYFIGIGGISMSALAKLLSIYGYEVSGSDGVRSEEVGMLAFYGIKVFIGEDGLRAELQNADAVVYTDAIPPEHAERQRAEILQKRIYSRAELLGLICGEFSSVLAVAGSHGKTTCTSMCAHIFKQTGVPVTAHIGGEDSAMGNFYSSGSEYFITEACEYKKNLLKVKATTAVLLNIDQDHMECYDGEEDLRNCFLQYCQQAKTAFVCADDEKCFEVCKRYLAT